MKYTTPFHSKFMEIGDTKDVVASKQNNFILYEILMGIVQLGGKTLIGLK